jgi:hypothetical protein
MGWTLNNKFIEQLGLEHVLRWAGAVGTATKQLTIQNRITFASGAVIASTVYLPPVHEAIGLFFVVVASSVTTGTVTVAPFKGGQSTADSVFYENEGTLGGGSATSEVITAANGWVVDLSLGDRWLVVADDLDAT